MKKFIYLFALMTLVMFASCDDKNNDESKQTFTSTTNSRAFNGGEMVFSQGTGKAEINFTKQTVQFTNEFKDADGHTRTINSPAMSLTSEGINVYGFKSDASGDYSNLRGNVDLATGMMWYTFNLNDGTTVVSTVNLMYAFTILYAYATTSISSEQGNTYNHEQSAYLFALDSKAETCIMQISNFIPDTYGAVRTSVVEYRNLNVTPTATGYVISADELESTYAGLYPISDLKFTLDEQCRVINGSFKSNNHTFTVSGSMFPAKN